MHIHCSLVKLQNNFDKTDILIKTDDFIFLQKISL